MLRLLGSQSCAILQNAKDPRQVTLNHTTQENKTNNSAAGSQAVFDIVLSEIGHEDLEMGMQTIIGNDGRHSPPSPEAERQTGLGDPTTRAISDGIVAIIEP